MEKKITRWLVHEDEEYGLQYIAGLDEETKLGVVSAPVIAFDPATARGIDAAGTVFQLSGEFGYDREVLSAWCDFCRAENSTGGKDISREFRASITKADMWDGDERKAQIEMQILRGDLEGDRIAC